jgi:hypothetical protein
LEESPEQITFRTFQDLCDNVCCGPVGVFVKAPWQRERERERENIFLYIYIERERETKKQLRGTSGKQTMRKQ